tara:strand:+ start:455 stop:787 length:333 start_codon:yes stop_codon:yes gene_type:complete
METPKIREAIDGVTFSIRVQPRSSKNEIIGVENGSLKIKLTSPPVENAANQQCIKVISKWLGVSRSRVQIISGLKSRNKKIKINGMGENNFNLFIKYFATKSQGIQGEKD